MNAANELPLSTSQGGERGVPRYLFDLMPVQPIDTTHALYYANKIDNMHR